PRWEHTSPPWELPGWDDAAPAQHRARDDNAHPSGPLPQVSGPMPRLSPEAWPPAESGPLPPVPREARPPGEPGYPRTRRDDTSYLRTGYTDPGYARVGSRYEAGADYAEPSRPGTGFARGDYPRGDGGGPGYPGPDPGYDDTGYHDSFPSRGGRSRDDYAQ